MDDIWKTVRPVLWTSAQRWTALAISLPEEMFGRSPVAGEWSATECLQHVLDTERLLFPIRLEAFLAGEDLKPFEPGPMGPIHASPTELASHFAKAREVSLARLGEVTIADFQRSVHHPELGDVTLGQLLYTWAAHDLMHTVQAERALMQPLILGTGPWETYFLAHRID